MIMIALFASVRFLILSDTKSSDYLRSLSGLDQYEQSFLTALSRSKHSLTFEEFQRMFNIGAGATSGKNVWTTLSGLEKRRLVKRVLFESNLELLLGWRLSI